MDNLVERVADRIEERMGPLFGSPEYLADPVKLVSAEKRRREAAVSNAEIAITETLNALMDPSEEALAAGSTGSPYGPLEESEWFGGDRLADAYCAILQHIRKEAGL